LTIDGGMTTEPMPTRIGPAGAPTVVLVLALAAGAFLRLWQLDAMGYNTDEAVYVGQGAAIADDPTLRLLFPAFRSHPILFQSFLSLGLHFGVNDLYGRLVAVSIGLATVYLTYLAGRDLYGARAGSYAALFVALMPYHVVVTRQVLLDGPMTLFSTLALFALGRYALTARAPWLYLAGTGFGLTFLAKTNGIVMVGALYMFLALSATIRVRLRDLAIALVCMALVIAPHPLTINLAGRAATGQQYLAWQLFRRPNHEWHFYLANVPLAIGPLVVLAALGGLWLLRGEHSWREMLLVSWIVVPVAFFELWPTKGFQYLLPIAPAVAILAGRTLVRWLGGAQLRLRAPGLQGAAVVLVAVSLAVASWWRVQPSEASSFTAGTGGVPGGREAGGWIRENVPEGAQMLAIGPSMANILQFYGHRKVYGLAVSPNPLRRNPSYQPVDNPDARIRNNEIQYAVWDAFSAERSPFFSARVLRYVGKYHGRAVHTESVTVTTASGAKAEKAVIVVYELRP
jgi:4-amino-4-deoxy-L-arabinose transferase-like glycosyltransferase